MKTIEKLQLWFMDVTYALADALFGLSYEEKLAWWKEQERLKQIIEK